MSVAAQAALRADLICGGVGGELLTAAFAERGAGDGHACSGVETRMARLVGVDVGVGIDVWVWMWICRGTAGDGGGAGATAWAHEGGVGLVC